MTRGRRREPAEIKQAKGNPGKRPVAKPQTGDLENLAQTAPGNLTSDGKELWTDIYSQLSQINLLRSTDRNVLARYCDTLSEFWRVTKTLREENQGYTYEAEKIGGGTMLRVNPLFMVQDRLSRRLDTLENNLGMNPRARHELLFRLSQNVPLLPLDDNKTPAASVSPASGPVGYLNQDNGGRLN